MAWHYRAPMSFPATFLRTIRMAAADPETLCILWSAESRREVEKVAEQFRWFKWCVKQRDAMRDVAEIIENYDLRTSIKDDDVGFILYLTARRTKVSEFIRLNPELARSVLPHCQ